MDDIKTCSKTKNGSIKTSGNNAVEPLTVSDDIDDIVSTPYLSAPASPGHGPYVGGFFYSAPASPMHYSVSSITLEHASGSFEFELSGEPAPLESMISADELFLNGQIRPMKLSSHLQRPQNLAPMADIAVTDDGEHDGYEDPKFGRGRAFQARDRRRKARSMSPLRSNTAFQWLEKFKEGKESTEINEIKEKLEEGEDKQEHETPSSGASSRSSSVGRSSKRWVFLKELLYRSKSEGRNRTSSNRNHKFWSTLSFSPSSGKKSADLPAEDGGVAGGGGPKTTAKKALNGIGVNRKRRVGRSPSAHEVHYTWNRAQAEEMRKKTYLPYRQGLLGCLGFSSKSYGAVNGLARALNPVSSR